MYVCRKGISNIKIEFKDISEHLNFIYIKTYRSFKKNQKITKTLQVIKKIRNFDHFLNF